MAQSGVKKIIVNDVNFYFLTKPDSSFSNFNISLTDGHRAYVGKLTEEEISDFSSKLKKTPEVYTSLFYNAFSLGNDDMKFSYNISNDGEGKATLSWKHIVKSGFIVTLGKIALQETNSNNLMIQILNEAFDQLTDSNATIKSMEKEQKRLKTDHEKAMKMLDQFVLEKQELEEQLYSKFVCILNSKKEKIRQLKQGEIQSGVHSKESSADARNEGTSDGAEIDRDIPSPKKNARVKSDDELFQACTNDDSTHEISKSKTAGRCRITASRKLQRNSNEKACKVQAKSKPSKMSSDEGTDELMGEL